MIELFKAIKGFEDYKVSNKGVVVSFKFGKTRMLKGGISGDYKTVTLSMKGLSKTKSVHILVAEAFLGHNGNGYEKVIDHIDNNPLNNVLSNLRVTTVRDNVSKDRKGKTSKYTGVSLSSRKIKKWVAQININGKVIKLGRFKTEIEAYLVYKKELDAL